MFQGILEFSLQAGADIGGPRHQVGELVVYSTILEPSYRHREKLTEIGLKRSFTKYQGDMLIVKLLSELEYRQKFYYMKI